MMMMKATTSRPFVASTTTAAAKARRVTPCATGEESASSAAVGPLPLKTGMSGTDFAETLPGVISPTGFLDPLQFSSNRSEAEIKRYREAELMHGRVSMLATVGFLTGEFVEGRSFLFESQISGPAIGHFQQVETVAPAFWETIAIAIAIVETLRVQIGWADPLKNDAFSLKDEYYPGDLSFDPLGLTPDNQEEFDLMQQRELSHCRLAMISISGMVAQELVDGKGIVEHWTGRFPVDM